MRIVPEISQLRVRNLKNIHSSHTVSNVRVRARKLWSCESSAEKYVHSCADLCVLKVKAGIRASSTLSRVWVLGGRMPSEKRKEVMFFGMSGARPFAVPARRRTRCLVRSFRQVENFPGGLKFPNNGPPGQEPNVKRS